MSETTSFGFDSQTEAKAKSICETNSGSRFRTSQRPSRVQEVHGRRVRHFDVAERGRHRPRISVRASKRHRVVKAGCPNSALDLPLAERIGDSVAREGETLPLAEAQRQELDRRLEDYERILMRARVGKRSIGVSSLGEACWLDVSRLPYRTLIDGSTSRAQAIRPPARFFTLLNPC